MPVIICALCSLLVASVHSQDPTRVAEGQGESNEPPELSLPSTQDWNEIVQWSALAYDVIGRKPSMTGVSAEKRLVSILGGKETREVNQLLEDQIRQLLPPNYWNFSSIFNNAVRGMLLFKEGDIDGDQYLQTLSAWIVLSALALTTHDGKRVILVENPGARPGEIMPHRAELWETAAHEVAHVWQHQVRPEAFRTYATTEERGMATFLIEGEAELMVEALKQAMKGRTLADLTDEELAANQAQHKRSQPDAYALGCAYLLAAYREGGWPAVDVAFESLPPSTEQLLHPEKRGKDLPCEVTLPPWPEQLGDIEAQFFDTQGERGIFGFGVEEAPGLRLGTKADDPVAVGWDGDRLGVARSNDGTLAVVWRTVWDRELDAEQFIEFGLEDSQGTHRHDGQVVDWAWSTDPSIQALLLERLAAHDQKELPEPEDAESTALIESNF